MKCREIEAHLSAYLAEETAPGLRRSIKAHFKGCKKCRARLEGLSGEKNAQEKEQEAAIPAEEVAPSPHQPSLPSPESAETSWLLWPHPVGMTVTIVLIGGIFFLYHRGASELRRNVPSENVASAAAEAFTASAPAGGDRGAQGKEAPIPPPPPPAQVHQAATRAVSKEPRGQAARPRPPAVKLLLISRNIEEAAASVAAQTTVSEGKVLSKKEDEMAAKMVLLIPPERYETFSRSLQSLGLVKEISRKEPPAEGSLRIEVMIE